MTQFCISILLVITLNGKIQTTEWQTLDFNYFKLKTPKGWTIVKQQGEDAYVGGITNGKDSLSFYYGWYIHGFKNEESGKFVILNDTINSKFATIRIPKERANGRKEMFIDNGMNKFAMWTDNMNDTILIFKIFKSIRFKN